MLVQEMTVKKTTAWKIMSKSAPGCPILTELVISGSPELILRNGIYYVLIFLIIGQSIKIQTVNMRVVSQVILIEMFSAKSDVQSVFFLTNKRVSSSFFFRPVGGAPAPCAPVTKRST